MLLAKLDISVGNARRHRIDADAAFAKGRGEVPDKRINGALPPNAWSLPSVIFHCAQRPRQAPEKRRRRELQWQGSFRCWISMVKQSTLIKSPRRPRKTKTWPLKGSSDNAALSRAASQLVVVQIVLARKARQRHRRRQQCLHNLAPVLSRDASPWLPTVTILFLGRR
jgi:hypothetical protein